jgi:hypothetical protein
MNIFQYKIIINYLLTIQRFIIPFPNIKYDYCVILTELNKIKKIIDENQIVQTNLRQQYSYPDQLHENYNLILKFNELKANFIIEDNLSMLQVEYRKKENKNYDNVVVSNNRKYQLFLLYNYYKNIEHFKSEIFTYMKYDFLNISFLELDNFGEYLYMTPIVMYYEAKKFNTIINEYYNLLINEFGTIEQINDKIIEQLQ